MNWKINTGYTSLIANYARKALKAVAKGKGHYKKVWDQAQVKNFLNSSKTKFKTDNSKNDCSIYDNNGNIDILKIETPRSRMEKVQTKIPSTYNVDKNCLLK